MSDRLTYLFQRYLNRSCSQAERTELMGLALEENLQEELKKLISDAWSFTGTESAIGDREKEQLLSGIFSGQLGAEGETGISQRAEGATLHRGNFNWKRWAVAASVLVLLGLSFFILRYAPGEKKKDPVAATDVEAPKVSKASITLADGRVIAVEELSRIDQASVSIQKTADGRIVYRPDGRAAEPAPAWNTLSNPRGSKVIDLTLSDGSRVWLNAGSSITYPVAFNGNERKVSMTGEAYFEASPSPSAGGVLRPFRVQSGLTTVTVLGTHFNVNAYDDEAAIKVTLLEGSVNVSNAQQSLIIKPNQQAVVTAGSVSLNSDVNVDEVMAWKNGRFQFGGIGIEEVMRQISRWYDVEVMYEVKPQDVHFRGGISRDVEASKVLKMLETTEAVHFRIEGRKVFVIK